MLERLSHQRRNLALTAFAVLALLLAWSVREVLTPVGLAYLLAFIVHPAVLNLERRGWSRLGAVNLIYATLFVATIGLSMGLYSQGQQLIGRVNSAEGVSRESLIQCLDRRFEEFIEPRKDQVWISWLFDDDDSGDGPADDSQVEAQPPSVADTVTPEEKVAAALPLEGVIPPEETGQTAEETGQTAEETGQAAEETGQAAGEAEAEPSYFVHFARRIWSEIRGEPNGYNAGKATLREAGSMIGFLSHWFGSLIGFVTLIFLLPIYTWYLLFELESIHAFIRRYVPERERGRVNRIGLEIGAMISAFFRGRLLVCLLKGLLLALGLSLAGLPYALFLGLLAGILSLIPFAGALVGFVFAYGVLALETNDPLTLLLQTGLVFGTVEAIEGYLLVPKILGDSLGLHPMVVFIAVFIGGSALGMFGLLLALPLAAAVIILVRELVLPALAEFADEPEAAGAASGSEPGLSDS